MQSENKIAIVVVTYNTPSLLLKQIECIKKMCKDQDYSIVIVDNSTDEEAIKAIKWYAIESGCEYMKTFASSKNGSSSHSFSANTSYYKLKDYFDFFFYLDHDCFPVKPFSVEEILKDKSMAGLGQEKNGKTYMWPGCVMWKEEKGLEIDFYPNSEFGLDTGGNLYKAIERVGLSECAFFDEHYEENPYFITPPYNYYSMIGNATFMHFVNGSGWNGKSEERINSLLNVLEDKI